MAEKRQLVIIGAGPGGYGAAFMAADLGLEVTLVDPEANPGGVCLYRGCIPTKALLHAAKVMNDIKRAREWGLKVSEPEVELEKLRSWNRGVVDKLTGGLGQLAKRRKIEHLRGRARFVDPKTVEISMQAGDSQDKGSREQGENRRLSFEAAIIATGAEPAGLPGVSFDSPRIMDSTAALRLEELPERLLVIGGGYIGLELSTVYASLGSKVTIVEMMPAILPGTDRDLVKVFSREAEQLFESIRVNTTAELEVGKKKVRATLKPKDGQTETEEFDRVLLAVGRKPNTKQLGLENTGIEPDEKGFIPVDERRQTAESSIYAIGDVTGNPLFAHKATHEGRVAAEAVAGKKTAYEPRAIPAVEYIDPEIAWCGLTEIEAEEQNRKVEVARFNWGASGRNTTLGRRSGLTKLIIDPESERILGVGIVGESAGELISEGALAVEMAAVASDVSLTVHPHPTLSETIMEAAESFYGTATSIYRPKRNRK
jgi:dihydrolipoamide dehydrogenase